MRSPHRTIRMLLAVGLFAGLCLVVAIHGDGYGGLVAIGCTSLAYRDKSDRVYFGRTLELAYDLPYQLGWVPAGQAFASEVPGAAPLRWTSRHGMLAVAVPDRAPAAGAPLTLDDFKVLEGLNDAGLSFSLLSYPSAEGAKVALDQTRAALSAVDLGAWTLGQFDSVAAVRAALAEQPVVLTPLAQLGGARAPFHYVLHDRSGAAIVIEFSDGRETVHDNPVGVMTNGPAFDWHLVNLANYTHLTNLDRSAGAFGSLKVRQPDSGIATAGLPASNTSVGRFVRAAYYAQFAEVVDEPDAAVRALARIMDNFDRPKGVTIDAPDGGADPEAGTTGSGALYSTEFTAWTILSDLERRRAFLRTYEGLNYTGFDLAALDAVQEVRIMPLAALGGLAPDGTAALTAAAA